MVVWRSNVYPSRVEFFVTYVKHGGEREKKLGGCQLTITLHAVANVMFAPPSSFSYHIPFLVSRPNNTRGRALHYIRITSAFGGITLYDCETLASARDTFAWRPQNVCIVEPLSLTSNLSVDCKVPRYICAGSMETPNLRITATNRYRIGYI